MAAREPTVALIEAELREDPSNWTAWRVYGDWLLEQGDVRGRIIGLKHALAAPGLDRDTVRALSRELEALWAEHRASWLGGLTVHTEPSQWCRGFLLGVSVGGTDALRMLAAVLTTPSCRLLTAARAHGGAREELPALLAVADQVVLRHLMLEQCGLVDEDAAALAACAALGELRTLQLAGNHLTAEGRAALAASPHLRACRVSAPRQRRRPAEAP